MKKKIKNINAIKGSERVAIKEIMKRYGLDPFEEKIIMFFMDLEFSGKDKINRAASEVVNLLAPKNSLLEKMKKLSYFGEDSALLKSRVLLQERNYY
ncbi:MAG: hypothetical protein ABH875_02285, partial [Candidatus Omnitrophota bacterium]